MAEKYIINGREYSSLDEIPPEDRKFIDAQTNILKNEDGDGVADLFQGLKGNNISISKSKFFSITRDGSGEVVSHVSDNMEDSIQVKDLLEQAKHLKDAKDKSGASRTSFEKLVIIFLILIIVYLILDKLEYVLQKLNRDLKK